jgi:hypothetical protein
MVATAANATASRELLAKEAASRGCKANAKTILSALVSCGNNLSEVVATFERTLLEATCHTPTARNPGTEAPLPRLQRVWLGARPTRKLSYAGVPPPTRSLQHYRGHASITNTVR